MGEQNRPHNSASELMRKLERMWNLSADEFNKWDALGLDEKLEFAIVCEREECARIVECHPYGTGLAGRLYAEALRGYGYGFDLMQEAARSNVGIER